MGGAIKLAQVVLALSLLVTACSDSGSARTQLSLEDYFAAVRAIDLETADEMNRLDEEFVPRLEAASDERTYLATLREYSAAVGDAGGSYLDELADLDPPPEAEEAHLAYVGGLQVERALLEELTQQLGDVESLEEVQPFLGSPEVLAAEVSAGLGCEMLQAIADEHGVDVDLECEAFDP